MKMKMKMMQQHITSRLSFSSALSNSTPAFNETSNLVRGSKIQWRRSSFAASAPSDSSSEAKRSRKWVSKDERRSMVESFVNKYRAMNSGKFPTVKTAHKEVGGSYYIVRKMVQELQYESQMSSTSRMKESKIQTEIHKKIEPSTDSEDVLSRQIAVEVEIADTVETVKTSVENREAMSHKSSSVGVQVSSSQMKDEISDDFSKGNEAPIRKEIAGESEQTDTEVPLIAHATSNTEVLKNDTSRFMTSGETQAVHKNDISTEVEPVSNCLPASAEIDNWTSHPSDAYTADVSDKHIKEYTSTSVLEEKTSFNEIGRSSVTGDNSEAVARKSDLLNEEPERLHSPSEISGDKIKEETTSKDVLECDAMKSKDNQLEQSPEPEKFSRDLSKEQTDDAESPKKSFTWKHLKSLADGILNMWRKL